MQIIYFYDALCGWCYGFSPVIKKLYEKYSPAVEFQVVSGGMITGKRVGLISRVAGYISHAYRAVENRTGITFGKAFLEVMREGSQVFDSKPPGIAMTIFKEMLPEKALLFAHDIQKALYFDGKDLNDVDVYIPIIDQYRLEKSLFRAKFLSEEYRLKTQAEFELVGQAGINGYPTVILQKADAYSLLSHGYQDFERLESKLLELL